MSQFPQIFHAKIQGFSDWVSRKFFCSLQQIYLIFLPNQVIFQKLMLIWVKYFYSVTPKVQKFVLFLKLKKSFLLKTYSQLFIFVSFIQLCLPCTRVLCISDTTGRPVSNFLASVYSKPKFFLRLLFSLCLLVNIALNSLYFTKENSFSIL